MLLVFHRLSGRGLAETLLIRPSDIRLALRSMRRRIPTGGSDAGGHAPGSEP